MEIIIVGCGKVGRTLAEQLVSERHNVTVVDTNPAKIQQTTEGLDVMGLVGNGTSINVLTEAGVASANILIAVTGSDELNLLCCLIAKKAGNCRTIARVRNPMYNAEIDFIKAQMGISMIINPELAAALEISRLLQFPSASKVDTFAKGKIHLLKLTIHPGSLLDGTAVRDISQKVRCDILVCAVEREDAVSIPSGDYVLKQNDIISIVASADNVTTFFSHMKLATRPVKNALIVGGGTIGYYLAKRLCDSNIRVRIVESDKERCELLSELLPEATVIHGDGTDKHLLMSEGLIQTEAFITLTNLDEENLLLSLFAKETTRAKLVTKVNRLAFDDIIERMNLGSVIYPKYITADYILQYVRAQQNSVGNNIETLYRLLDNRVEALEFNIHETSPVLDIPLIDLDLKPNQLICFIKRGDRVFIPRGQDTIQMGDYVVVVTLEKGLHDIRDILKK